MSFANISSALMKQLTEMASVPPIAEENFKYTPTQNELYLRVTNIPSEVTQATLGDTGEDLNKGIFQVDVISQADTGMAQSITQADLVADRFKRGTDIVYNGVTVRVKNVSLGTATNDKGWQLLPVFINYFAYTSAR